MVLRIKFYPVVLNFWVKKMLKKSISIELNEEYISQYQNVFKILTKLNFNLKHKKHADMFDINNKFSKLYNFVFDKHVN